MTPVFICMQEQQQDSYVEEVLREDEAVLKENGLAEAQTRQSVAQSGAIKSHYWKFVGGFFALMLIGFIGIPFVGNYMQKQEKIEQEKKDATSIQRMYDIQEMLKNDKDGGATPEETLQLFTDALKKGDIAQAEKYFVIYPEDQRSALIERLEKIKADNKLDILLGHIAKSRIEDASEVTYGNAWFSYVENKRVQIAVEITKGKYSTVWKIENLMF